MKKVYVAAALLILGLSAKAQVTLLSEDFQGSSFPYIQIAYPPGNSTDTSWYSVDVDQLIDGSTGGTRPEQWYITLAYATADSLTTDGDTNFILSSSSWFAPAAQAENWFITKSIDVPPGAGTLKWKSSTFQTPYYLDKYEVRISTTDNDPASFSDMVYRSAEYTAGTEADGQAGNYAGYTFAPAGEWTQGFDDATNTIVMAEVEFDGDQARYKGRLIEKTVDLSAYANQTIFIGFLHNSDDDNLVGIDDIEFEWTVGIAEQNTITSLTAYPNPTVDYVNIAYNMSNASPVIVTVTDVYGRIVATESLGIVAAGANTKQLDATGFATGTYNVQFRSDKGTSSFSFVKN